MYYGFSHYSIFAYTSNGFKDRSDLPYRFIVLPINSPTMYFSHLAYFTFHTINSHHIRIASHLASPRSRTHF